MDFEYIIRTTLQFREIMIQHYAVAFRVPLQQLRDDIEAAFEMSFEELQKLIREPSPNETDSEGFDKIVESVAPRVDFVACAVAHFTRKMVPRPRFAMAQGAIRSVDYDRSKFSGYGNHTLGSGDFTLLEFRLEDPKSKSDPPDTLPEGVRAYKRRYRAAASSIREGLNSIRLGSTVSVVDKYIDDANASDYVRHIHVGFSALAPSAAIQAFDRDIVRGEDLLSGIVVPHKALMLALTPASPNHDDSRLKDSLARMLSVDRHVVDGHPLCIWTAEGPNPPGSILRSLGLAPHARIKRANSGVDVPVQTLHLRAAFPENEIFWITGTAASLFGVTRSLARENAAFGPFLSAMKDTSQVAPPIGSGLVGGYAHIIFGMPELPRREEEILTVPEYFDNLWRVVAPEQAKSK
jgi:hypothetical protein